MLKGGEQAGPVLLLCMLHGGLNSTDACYTQPATAAVFGTSRGRMCRNV